MERLLRTHREEIVEKQYQAGRVADAAIELYVSGCVLRRLDTMLSANDSHSVQTHADAHSHGDGHTNSHPSHDASTSPGVATPGLHHDPNSLHRDLIAGRYYLRSAERRIRRALADLWDNDDEFTTRAANAVLP